MNTAQILNLSASVFFGAIAWLPAEDSLGIRIVNAINIFGAIFFAYSAGVGM